MSTPRFYLPGPLSADDIGRQFALPDATAHHALRVLRMAVGDALTLFTGTGGEFAATLAHADKRQAFVRIDAFSPVEREAPMALTLVQAVAASDAMDMVVRGAVELGVAAIQPVMSARSAALPGGARSDKRVAHWRQIAVAACEQCGRNRVPPVRDLLSLADWFAQRGPAPGVVLAPDAGATIATMTRPAHEAPNVDVLIGPEGGLTADEVAAAVRAGLTETRMGPRILRTGTAALAALAVVNAAWGDFR